MKAFFAQTLYFHSPDWTHRNWMELQIILYHCLHPYAYVMYFLLQQFVLSISFNESTTKVVWVCEYALTKLSLLQVGQCQQCDHFPCINYLFFCTRKKVKFITTKAKFSPHSHIYKYIKKICTEKVPITC